MGAFGAALALQTLRPCTYPPGRGQAPSFPRPGYAQGGLRPRSGTSRICAPVHFLLADQDNAQHRGGGQCVERFFAWSRWTRERDATLSACPSFAGIAPTPWSPARCPVSRAWSFLPTGAFALASRLPGRLTATKGHKRPCPLAWIAAQWGPLKTPIGIPRAFPFSPRKRKFLRTYCTCLRLPGYWQGVLYILGQITTSGDPRGPGGQSVAGERCLICPFSFSRTPRYSHV